MLKKLRVVLALVFWVGITLLLLDFSGALHHWLGWMAKLQFLPAVLALNVGVVFFLILLTLVFGRVYCSVICPLGVLQDGISWLGTRKSKAPYKYKKELKWLRYGVWALFVIALIAGVQVFVALLAPYSAYGRMVQNLLQPLYLWGNNLFAYLAEKAGSYAFYPREVWIRSLPTFIAAAVMLVIIVVLSFKGGRTYCNTICPVGTTLSFLSAKAQGETTKVTIRNVRRDGIDLLKKAQKNEGLSEDGEKEGEAELQKITDKWVKKVDEVISAKEKDILTV